MEPGEYLTRYAALTGDFEGAIWLEIPDKAGPGCDCDLGPLILHFADHQLGSMWRLGSLSFTGQSVIWENERDQPI